MAFSLLCCFAHWLSRPPPVEHTGDSLLRLVFQFTERQQVSVASHYWLTVTSINVIRDKLNNKWSQFTKSVIFGFICSGRTIIYSLYLERLNSGNVSTSSFLWNEFLQVYLGLGLITAWRTPRSIDSVRHHCKHYKARKRTKTLYNEIHV